MYKIESFRRHGPSYTSTKLPHVSWATVYMNVLLCMLGEKLSKKQLQNSNTIKKLRAKEKESETQIASSR